MNEKVALVTGASGGIGSAVAKCLVGKVAVLIICGRDETKLEKLQAELQAEANASVVKLMCFDVADEAAIKDAFKQLHQQFKRLDILVNCAGQMLEAPLMMTTPAQMQQSFAVNTLGSLLCCQLASRLMARRQSGSIVNVSSVVADQGASGQVVYSAAKSALHGMTKSLAKELAAAGVRINAVTPGFIDTELVAHYDNEQRQQIKESTALGRIGDAKEVAATIAFLASDEASYITGQVIAVDGMLQL